MKNTNVKKTVATLIAAISMFSMALCACSSEPADPVVGEWEIVAACVGSITVPVDEGSLHFKANGSCSLYDEDDEYCGSLHWEFVEEFDGMRGYCLTNDDDELCIVCGLSGSDKLYVTVEDMDGGLICTRAE